MEEDCSVCGILIQIREQFARLGHYINLGNSGQPKSKRQEFGFRLNAIENLDKQVGKLAGLHDQYHDHQDQTLRYEDPTVKIPPKKKGKGRG